MTSWVYRRPRHRLAHDGVEPGETMELRFVLWDTGDEWYDSLVPLDDFQWSLQASEPGVVPG